MRLKRGVIGVLMAAGVMVLTACQGGKREAMRDTSEADVGTHPPALQLRLEHGEAYRIQISRELTLFGTVWFENGIRQFLRVGFLVSVVDIDPEGVISLRYRIEQIRYNFHDAWPGIDYDSENPDSYGTEETRTLARLVGKEFPVRVRPTGEVIEFTGWDESFLDAITQARSTPESQKRLLEQLNYGEMLELIQTAYVIFTTQPRAAGDEWSNLVVDNLEFPIVLENQWTLRSITDKTAYVSLGARIKPAPGGDQVKICGETLGHLLIGVQAGQLVVDEDTGWTREGMITRVMMGERPIHAFLDSEGKQFRETIKLETTFTFQPY